jgi:hypothetical protein
LNFVEIMAMQRLFTVGRLKCSEIAPKITIGQFFGAGYVLAIKKANSHKHCLGCVKMYFAQKEGLQIVEDKDYLTISSI